MGEIQCWEAFPLQKLAKHGPKICFKILFQRSSFLPKTCLYILLAPKFQVAIHECILNVYLNMSVTKS